MGLIVTVGFAPAGGDSAQLPTLGFSVAAPPVFTPTISVTLTDANNAALASLTGLAWAWWDSTDLSAIGAPSVKGSGASTNGSGVFSVTTLTGSALTAAGQVGWIEISNSDGDPANNATYKVASGPVTVS